MSNADNCKEFNLDLDAIAAKFNLTAEKALRAIALDAFETIIRLTPVGDPDYWDGHPRAWNGNVGNLKPPKGYIGGNARNNWWISFNQPIGDPSGRNPDQSASNQSAADAASVVNAKIGDRIYFQNGVPHILKLENGSGSPRQAPHGMVAITFANLEAHFSAVLATSAGVAP